MVKCKTYVRNNQKFPLNFFMYLMINFRKLLTIRLTSFLILIIFISGHPAYSSPTKLAKSTHALRLPLGQIEAGRIREAARYFRGVYGGYADALDIPELAVLDRAEKTHYELVHQTQGVKLDTHQATLDWLDSLTETEKGNVYTTDQSLIRVNVALIPTLVSIAALRVGTLNGKTELFLLKPGDVFCNAVLLPLLDTVVMMRELGEPITNVQVIELMSPYAIHDMEVAFTISPELVANYQKEIERAPDNRKQELEKTLRVLMEKVGTKVYLHAFRVQDDVTLGPVKGGLRYAPIGDLDLVRTLAALMTWKDTILAYGGGKGEVSFTLPDGTSIDPRLLPLADKAELSRSFARGEQGTRGLAYIIGSLRDIPAGDMNTDSAVMAWIADEILRICVEKGWDNIDGIPVPLRVLREAQKKAESDPDPTETHYLTALMEGFKRGDVPSLALIGMITGKPFRTTDEGDLADAYGGGHAFRNDATGVGQVQATAHAIAQGAVRDLQTLHDATASIQGFGNVAMAAALEAYNEFNVKVMGVSDISGSIYVEEGSLPIDEIVKWFEDYKVEHARYPTLHQWYEAEGKNFDILHDEDSKYVLYMDVDIVFPDALQEQITVDNADQIKALVVSEGANAPTTPEADKILQSKGIIVLPDFLFNAGGVAGSYIEWIKNMTMTLAELESMTEKEMYEEGKTQVVGILNRAFDEVVTYCKEKSIPYAKFRSVARILAIKRILNPRDPATRPELQGEVVVVDEQGNSHQVPLHVLVSRKGEQLAAYLQADYIMEEALDCTRQKRNLGNVEETIRLLQGQGLRDESDEYANGSAHSYLQYAIASHIEGLVRDILGDELIQAYMLEKSISEGLPRIGQPFEILFYISDDADKDNIERVLSRLGKELLIVYKRLLEGEGVKLGVRSLVWTTVINQEDVRKRDIRAGFLRPRTHDCGEPGPEWMVLGERRNPKGQALHGTASRGSVWGLMKTLVRLGYGKDDRITIQYIKDERYYEQEDGTLDMTRKYHESTVRREFRDAEDIGLVRRIGKDKGGNDIYLVLADSTNDQLRALESADHKDLRTKLNRGRVRPEERVDIREGLQKKGIGIELAGIPEKQTVPLSSWEKQDVQKAWSKIIVWAAESVVTKDRSRFAATLNANETVIIIARDVDEYRQVEYLKYDERVHIKVVYGDTLEAQEAVDNLDLKLYQIIKDNTPDQLSKLFTELIIYGENGIDLKTLNLRKEVAEDIAGGV